MYPWRILRSLWRYRDLAWQFTVRSIEMRHKGSHLGLIWSVLNPLLILGLYLFVFGYVFGGKFGVLPHETHLDYALGLFVGLNILQMIIEVISVSPSIIVTQPNFVKKVIFPLEILPMSAVGASVFHFLISTVLATAGIATMGPGVSWTWMWLPVIILPVVLIALGLGWLISAIGVFVRDVGQAVQFLGQALLYASAVFYPVSIIPRAVWRILGLNPLVHAVELSRDCLLWHRAMNLAHLGYLYVCGIGIFAFGHAVFQKLKPGFSDVL